MYLPVFTPPALMWWTIGIIAFCVVLHVGFEFLFELVLVKQPVCAVGILTITSILAEIVCTIGLWGGLFGGIILIVACNNPNMLMAGLIIVAISIVASIFTFPH